MGIVTALEYKFQAFAGSDRDRTGKGAKARPNCLSHKVVFRFKNPFPHHTTMLNLGKSDLLVSYLATSSLVSTGTDRNFLKCSCAMEQAQLDFLETDEDRTKICVSLSRDITHLLKPRG